MDSHSEPDIIPTLERVTHLIGVWVEHALLGMPITQAEAHVLAFLAAHAECSINDLHHQFGHRRSTLTSVLDRLESRGLVRRGAHPASRRLVLVSLTETGSEIAVRVSAAVRALEDRLRERTSAGELAAFQAVLQALEEEVAHDR